ncbi:hypothetical protein D9611_002364 [Ephemerocybe angulata]|uniref:DNA replication factor Cdt1 C-terminal domain-containing protein n=1 Tax=Ephemerocybe angulata TaxID=980116 RepID=A0A8H5FEF4_9AGAR|nr:hypothetical protein D9611_002364 [Tulosesus angulatus]
MSDLYTSLRVSPRKKRGPPSDGGATTTPKKLRTTRPHTPQSILRAPKIDLPDQLNRLLKFHNAIQQALSHALATCAVSPSADSGRVLNVLNHISLQTYAGLTTSFGVEDLKRLCWIWEWDGESLPNGEEPSSQKGVEENPFLEEASSSSSEWTRGSMGFTISLGSHYSKSERKRIPVYGVGIEVEMDIDKDMGGGMAAVARWTAAGETRRAALLRKMEKWTELPPLPATTKPSALTRTLASASPKSSAAAQKFPIAPGSPSRSPLKKPRTNFALLFPALPRSQSPTKVGRLLFPQTPSKRDSLREETLLLTPRTPATSGSSSVASSVTSTPVHQRGSDAETVPQTPTTSRRQALYERIRARSLSKSPTKTTHSDGTPMSRDQMLKLGQDEMRRRCLLERLPGIAESVWMLFSNSGSTSSTATPTRKRRTMPVTDVLSVIIKSSPVPISNAEANESLNMLMQMCPFFLKKVVISGKEWLEMPSSQGTAAVSIPNTPTRCVGTSSMTASPTKGSSSAAHLLLTRSPKAVRHPQGGLREVREIIRREIELQD